VRRKEGLLAEELGRLPESLFQRLLPLLVRRQWKGQDRLPLGADTRSLLADLALRQVFLAAVEGVQKAQALEELGRLDSPQEALLRQPLNRSLRLAVWLAEPLLAQVHPGCPVSGVGRCQKLEDGERNAACIHLLEDQADGFLLVVLFQFDDGNVVVAELGEEILAKFHESLELVRVSSVK